MAKSKAKDKKWIIVKNANKVNWPFYYETDPKKGISVSHSAHNTDTGKECSIDSLYTDLQKANLDCETINTHNPAGNYAVCVINYGKTAIKH